MLSIYVRPPKLRPLGVNFTALLSPLIYIIKYKNTTFFCYIYKIIIFNFFILFYFNLYYIYLYILIYILSHHKTQCIKLPNETPALIYFKNK